MKHVRKVLITQNPFNPPRISNISNNKHSQIPLSEKAIYNNSKTAAFEYSFVFEKAGTSGDAQVGHLLMDRDIYVIVENVVVPMVNCASGGGGDIEQADYVVQGSGKGARWFNDLQKDRLNLWVGR